MKMRSVIHYYWAREEWTCRMGIVSRGLGDCVDVRLSNRSEFIK